MTYERAQEEKLQLAILQARADNLIGDIQVSIGNMVIGLIFAILGAIGLFIGAIVTNEFVAGVILICLSVCILGASCLIAFLLIVSKNNLKDCYKLKSKMADYANYLDTVSENTQAEA